ncbi:MAG: DUF4112 domain-containing protein [Novosphingobium sp.]
MGTDVQSVSRRIEALEQLLEGMLVLPVINRRIGLDSLLGLLPVAGDTIAALMGLYMVWEARNLGMSKWQQARMVGNVGFDWLIGLLPVAGDVADFLFRSNTRNLRIIRRHLDRHHPGTRTLDGAKLSSAGTR